MQKERVALLWFKRDLRTQDHPAINLTQEIAVRENLKMVAIYIVEPSYWNSQKASADQYGFVRESLENLRSALQKKIGARLLIRSGDAVETLESLGNSYEIVHLISHQETGNAWTFERDLRVKNWAKSQGIPWSEPRQQAVQRARAPQSWPVYWTNWVGEKIQPIGKRWLEPTLKLPEGDMPDTATICGEERKQDRQRGGERNALALLESFAAGRILQGAGYQKNISSPLTAEEYCSRLSPHLTWGTISGRKVYQALAEGKSKHHKSFLSRLAWRDHFSQTFEANCWLEHRSADGKDRKSNREKLKRWETGTTGYPYVDACMRSLNATGWLNFRGRALLVSFAAWHLGLDWKDFGPHLARAFLDYEPGIHYCQLQMQSGCIPNQTIRIYNVTKQASDHDPKGEFVKKWCPELQKVPIYAIQNPTKWDEKIYPKPIPLLNPKEKPETDEQLELIITA